MCFAQYQSGSGDFSVECYRQIFKGDWCALGRGLICAYIEGGAGLLF